MNDEKKQPLSTLTLEELRVLNIALGKLSQMEEFIAEPHYKWVIKLLQSIQTEPIKRIADKYEH